MKKNKSITIISILTILSFIIGFSYAYFTTIVIGNESASTHRVTTGKMQLTYSGVDAIDMENAEPPTTKTATFTVTNTGTINITSYQVYFSNVINTLAKPEEMVYTLTCTSSDANPCIGTTGEVQVPTSSSEGLTQTSIAPNTVHTYTLSVTFKDAGSNQNYNQDKQVSFKITINELEILPIILISKIAGYNEWEEPIYRNDLFWEHTANITEITFENQINIPSNTIEIWDVSKWQNNSIMAYIVDDGLNQNTYHLYIQSNEENIYANENMESWFAGFQNLITINNLSLLDTTQVTDMSGMFKYCFLLENIDLSNFNTSNVTNMASMFSGCESITNLNLSTFDTSQVTNMSEMFGVFDYHMAVSGFITLDLSSFNTEKVTDMSYMFACCNQLQNLNISTFDTSKVTNMFEMFARCNGLTGLDLSNFNTNQVINMSRMFLSCGNLTSLNLSNFNTSKVTNMSEMFNYCSSLTSLDLRNSSFILVTSYNNMFNNVTTGITIYVKDSDAETFINARLSDAGISGIVSIIP